MKITAQSPCRVDLAGGTLDIWPLYLFHEHAATVNFAIDIYTRCEIVTRADSRIVLRSADQGSEDAFECFDCLAAAKTYRLPLLASIVRFFRPTAGIEVLARSGAPAGAGIGGSSSLLVTLASALNKLMDAGYGMEKIREIAQNVEAQLLGVPTGCQDYYAALYGGVSAIDLTPAGTIRRALPVDASDINGRIVLAYTGEPRNSGINNWEVTRAHINGDKNVFANFAGIAAIAHAMRQALERSDWPEVGRLLREEWRHRSRNAPGITTERIERSIAAALRAGAIAAKVCGAGGGGCVFYLVEPGAQETVSRAVAAQGAEVLPVSVAAGGVRLDVVE